MKRFATGTRAIAFFAVAVALFAAPSEAQVVINELHYHPKAPNGNAEFIELHNSGGAPVDISGWTLSGFALNTFTFPAATSIAADGYVVVANDAALLQTLTGFLTPHQWATGNLSNGGETVSLTDNLVHLSAPNIHRSVGFSGVVSGIMAMFAVLLPLARVRFFYWFFAIVGSVSFPGLVVVAWFVGWDMWYLASNVHNGVSYLAHVAGALWGAAFALLFFWKRRHWSQDSSDVLEVTTNGRNIQQYDTGVKWFFKTWESVMAVPMYLGIFYLTSLWLMAMIVQFITSHPFKMLFLIPFLMSWIHIRRERKRVRPDHEHFKDAMADIDASHYKFGVAELERLAARGYTKAQVALGQLYATGKGLPRIDNKAAEWYRKAADAGSADALYALGLLIMNGRVVRQTPDEEDVLIEKAAKRGLPEAAMTLAWRFNNRKERDVEQAAYWYHRAGERYLQKGNRDDALVALREMEGFNKAHHLTQDLAHKLGLHLEPA